MASSSPVRICVMRQIASRDPKFHQAEMFEGAGRSMRELLTIFSRGWDFRMLGAIIGLCVDKIAIRMDRANDPK